MGDSNEIQNNELQHTCPKFKSQANAKEVWLHYISYPFYSGNQIKSRLVSMQNMCWTTVLLPVVVAEELEGENIVLLPNHNREEERGSSSPNISYGEAGVSVSVILLKGLCIP